MMAGLKRMGMEVALYLRLIIIYLKVEYCVWRVRRKLGGKYASAVNTAIDEKRRAIRYSLLHYWREV